LELISLILDSASVSIFNNHFEPCKVKLWKKKGNRTSPDRERKKEKNKKPSRLPSICERSETPGALDRRVHWESQETPVA